MCIRIRLSFRITDAVLLTFGVLSILIIDAYLLLFLLQYLLIVILPRSILRFLRLFDSLGFFDRRFSSSGGDRLAILTHEFLRHIDLRYVNPDCYSTFVRSARRLICSPHSKIPHSRGACVSCNVTTFALAIVRHARIVCQKLSTTRLRDFKIIDIPRAIVVRKKSRVLQPQSREPTRNGLAENAWSRD